MKEWIDSYEHRDWQQATDGTIRYALLGLGWWTVDLALPAIQNADLGAVTTLVSSTSQKAERIAAENDVAHGYSYDEFTAGEGTDHYDAIYVCTPNALHLDYVEAAAELGKPVICEKPIEATVERAARMVEAAEEGDIPLMIAYRMHTEPAVRRAKELIQDGFIGEPVSVHGHNSQPLLEMIPDPDQWRLNADLTGYGTSVMDLGIYSINTARFVLDRDPVAVQAEMHSGHEAFDDVADERSASLVALEDDIGMVMTSSQRAHRDTRLTITGTEGQVELRPAFHGEAPLHLSRGELTVDVTHDSFDAQREMREEFDYFADRILTDREVYADGRHGLVDIQTIEAIHEAGESDSLVEIDS